MIDVLVEVISEMMKDYLEKARFVSVNGDGSQAWKTGEEKELMYGKFLVRGDVGLFPCTFLLACQVMKDFGGLMLMRRRRHLLQHVLSLVIWKF